MTEENDPALALSNAFGFLFRNEVRLLEVLAHSLGDDAVIANVGAGTGTSALAMYMGNPKATIYTVDISTGGPLGGLQNESNAFEQANIERKPEHQILGDSRVVGHQWLRENRPLVDLAFIDADHTEPSIRGDIINWRPNVKPGGIMAFHDYEGVHWAAVKSVVDELMGDCIHKWQVDTIMVMWLPR